MVGPIKISCLLCKQEYFISVNEICWTCSSEKFLEALEKKDPTKEFWKNSKELALWSVFYIPTAVAIGRIFDFQSELLWLGGGVFIQLLTPFHRWLLSKF